MQEDAVPNIQNDFFNQVRREKRRMAIFLNNGKRLTGRIKSFDRFTILLETHQGEQMVFKHAIATVGPIHAQAPRPREGFNNRMDVSDVSREGGATHASPRPAGARPGQEHLDKEGADPDTSG
ncbi:MAG: RNA chaperone Hfq [Acidobacteriota bacterium]